MLTVVVERQRTAVAVARAGREVSREVVTTRREARDAIRCIMASMAEEGDESKRAVSVKTSGLQVTLKAQDVCRYY